MIVYTSKKGGGYLVKTEAISQSGILPQTVILIDPSKTYQTHWGFGASFTESAAAVLRDAGEQITAEAVAALFSREGNGYTLGRLHINSCDFSVPCRTYLAEHDETLASFDLSYDKNLIVPLVKTAERVCGNLFLTAAPWSPPAFMKDNRSMLRGGKLLKKYYPLWAEYLAAYVGEMQKCGVKIGAINIQNEPEALQPWESCLYTASEEGEMIKELARALKARGLDTKIAAVDHNRDILVNRAVQLFADAEVRSLVWGLAYHWYGCARHTNLAQIHALYPEKRLYLSECCVEYALKEPEGDAEELLWRHGERYGREIIEDFNNYSEGWIDFNMALNAQGGPNHVGNYCEAPLMFDGEKLRYLPSYYFIGHFSRFIRPEAVRLFTACGEDGLYATAYRNQDGSIVAAVQNEGGERAVNLRVGTRDHALTLPARSIQTFVL